jgi:hypothetical protein
MVAALAEHHRDAWHQAPVMGHSSLFGAFLLFARVKGHSQNGLVIPFAEEHIACGASAPTTKAVARPQPGSLSGEDPIAQQDSRDLRFVETRPLHLGSGGSSCIWALHGPSRLFKRPEDSGRAQHPDGELRGISH